MLICIYKPNYVYKALNGRSVMESDTVKDVRTRLEGKLQGLSEEEKSFAILICHGIAAGASTNKGVDLGYLDYFMWHSLIPPNRPDYLKIFNNPHTENFEIVYFMKALEFLEKKEIVKRDSNGNYLF